MRNDIRLVIADVDGTLITPGKILTPRSVDAVWQLREVGIAFTITSSRPPLGLKMLVGPLALSEPLAAFNGGALVRPDLSVLEESLLTAEIAGEVIATIRRHGLDAWLYTDREWLVRDPRAPHVAQEQRTLGFAPAVMSDFGSYLDRVAKIVGVGDNSATLARCEADLRRSCGRHALAARSQPYYLDVTHPNANKGQVVTALCEALSIGPNRVATIGDMPNDVLMFEKSGLSIAMGNASEEVQNQAHFVTSSNAEEGFARAMEAFVLGVVPQFRRRAS